jgi:polysaccharide biosynthesis/export protein
MQAKRRNQVTSKFIEEVSVMSPSRLLALAVCVIWVAPSFPQQVAPQQPVSQTPSAAVDQTTYSIGAGDVLSLTFANSPELNHKVQVSGAGDIVVPLLSTPVHATGLTPMQLSQQIAKELVDAKQLRDPFVSVFVDEHNSHSATVLGAVAKPGVYQLARPTRLLELLSMAGGLNTTAGATLSISHAEEGGDHVRDAKALPNTPTIIQIGQLTDNKDPALDLMIRSGDVINVSQAPLVYVVGAVTKPGGFVLPDPKSGITVLQAIALAEGLTPIASASKGLVIRRPPYGKERELVPVDISKLMNGKITDQDLQPNDILFIPQSGTKRTLQALARTAEASAAGVASYGLGLRLSK